MNALPESWIVAMEATILSDWIYDHLLPHATRSSGTSVDSAIDCSAKKKNDQIDWSTRVLTVCAVTSSQSAT
jgi:hypothetical protein